MSNYLDRFKNGILSPWRAMVLDSKSDWNIPLWSHIQKGNMLLYRILHYRKMGVKVLKVMMTWMSGAWRPIKTAKIMVCGTNLQILTEDHGVLWNLQSRPCLRNTNKFLNGSKMGKSWSTADWLALVSVDFLVFHTWSQKTLKCAVFWMQIMDYEASQDFWKQRGSVQYCFEYRSCWMEV